MSELQKDLQEANELRYVDKEKILRDLLSRCDSNRVPTIMENILQSTTFTLLHLEDRNKIFFESIDKCSADKIPDLMKIIVKSGTFRDAKEKSTQIQSSPAQLLSRAITKCNSHKIPELMKVIFSPEVLNGSYVSNEPLLATESLFKCAPDKKKELYEMIVSSEIYQRISESDRVKIFNISNPLNRTHPLAEQYTI